MEERKLDLSSVIIIIALIFFVSHAKAGSLYNSNNDNKVEGIFIFGDSLFDAGNNHYNVNCTAQADFPPYGSSFFHHPTGRFTNGRTVPDFISQFMGLPFQKPYEEVHLEIMNGTRKDYPSNGINFASAGSGVLRSTNNDSLVTPIQVQLQQFQTLSTQNLISQTLIRSSLFFVESGSNDIFNYFLPFNPPNQTPEAYVQSMLAQVEDFVSAIYKLGARRIALFGLGPVGCVPARVLLGAPATKCFEEMNKMVRNYNMGLENIAKSLPAKYHGAVGVYANVYETVQMFRTNPRRYRFTEVASACCGYGSLGGELQCGKEGYKICRNPNGYLFWDFFHPSEHTNNLISKAMWGGGLARIRPFNLKKLASMSNTVTADNNLM